MAERGKEMEGGAIVIEKLPPNLLLPKPYGYSNAGNIAELCRQTPQDWEREFKHPFIKNIEYEGYFSQSRAC